MAIDLTHTPGAAALVENTRAFTRDVVLPIEDANGGDALRADLQKAAREARVFAPHAPVEYGGTPKHDRSCARLRGGYSLFGPIALNIGAPDEGNVHMLAQIANDEQKHQLLAPLAPATCGRPSQ